MIYRIDKSLIPPWAQLCLPQAGGQATAFLSEAFELLGGGSAGGGKSWFLVIDALGLQYVDRCGKEAYKFPGYRAVLFRREATQLDKLITEAKKFYLPLGFVYVGGRQGEPGPCFEHPEFGSKIFMCHLQHEDDKENHQGQEYQYVGFDELTHFTITQYLYLFSRLRSTIPDLPVRVRSTTNPTGEGLWWVRKRFVDNWTPGTVRYFLGGEDPEKDPRGRQVPKGTKNALSRVFVPFWLSENKVLIDNDPTYASRMMQMGRQMERALLGGDWYAFGGDMFPDFDRHKEVVPPFTIPTTWKLIGSIDPGFSSPCSFGLTAADPKGNYYRIATYYEDLRAPQHHAKGIAQFIDDCKWTQHRWPDRIVSGRDAFAKQDRYSVVESDKTFADIFTLTDKRFLLEPAATDRLQGWWNWKALMPERWYIFDGLNEPLMDEMAAAVTDEKQPEELKGRGNDPAVKDHAMDENRYALMAIAKTAEKPPTELSWEDKWIKGVRVPDSNNGGWKPGRG